MWFAANPTAFEPEALLNYLRSGGAEALPALREIVARRPGADWERDLLDAVAVPSGEVRAALVNEQLTEFDRRIQRWSRVPRVCARAATSFGFLLATLVLRQGLGSVEDLSSDVGELVARGPVGDALTVAALGFVGMAFCVGAQGSARRLAAARMNAADRLVERLEHLLSPSA
jgi:hypothetical protein